jgi:hypothetical protein
MADSRILYVKRKNLNYFYLSVKKYKNHDRIKINLGRGLRKIL